MGVRPPANDSLDDGPDTVEFGIAALDARVEQMELSFPVTVGDLNAAYGDVRIAVDPAGNKIALREVLNECDKRRFESEEELQEALHPIFERKRERMSNSLFGRLRALVPF